MSNARIRHVGALFLAALMASSCTDATSAVIDPFFARPTVSVIANVADPVTGKDLPLHRRQTSLKST